MTNEKLLEDNRHCSLIVEVLINLEKISQCFFFEPRLITLFTEVDLKRHDGYDLAPIYSFSEISRKVTFVSVVQIKTLKGSFMSQTNNDEFLRNI